MSAKESLAAVNKKAARTIGVLFIIGTVGLIMSVFVAGPLLDGPEHLTELASNASRMMVGVLLVLLSGFALALIPAFLFPVLRKHDETVAVGYLVFRGVLESLAHIALLIVWLMLLALSREYGLAGPSNASALQSIGVALFKVAEWIPQLGAIAFCVGALMLYYALYQTRLVPRWLSGWGLAGAILYLVAPLSGLFASELGISMVPLALQEMVFAVWLITRGFSPSPIMQLETL